MFIKCIKKIVFFKNNILYIFRNYSQPTKQTSSAPTIAFNVQKKNIFKNMQKCRNCYCHVSGNLFPSFIISELLFFFVYIYKYISFFSSGCCCWFCRWCSESYAFHTCRFNMELHSFQGIVEKKTTTFFL